MEAIEEKEEAAPTPPSMDVDGSADEEEESCEGKGDTYFCHQFLSLDKSIVDSYRELESQMHAADKIVMDTEVNSFVLFSVAIIVLILKSQKCS